VPGTISNAARLAWICAIAAAVFVAWISTDVSPSAGIAFFYAVPIGLAAWWFGRRAAAAAVVGCCVLYYAGTLIQPTTHFGISLAIRLAVFIGVALIVSFLRDRVNVLEHSAEELEAIRTALTPSSLPELPNIEAAVAFVPSELGVSGDFYLITNGSDDSTVVVIGDVVGHGPEAARLATFIRTRFAAFAASTSDPAELLILTNEALKVRPGRRDELASAVCLRFQAEGTKLSWAIAGHPPPLRLPQLQELTAAGTTFLLGAEAELELHTAEAVLGEGEGVVLYTDGATDVRRHGSLLGRDGLSSLLAPLVKLPAQAIAPRIERAIIDWADEPVHDDLCVLVLRPRRFQG
jgi:serine phosphatase RsbU (regulator of sigma subunit)